METMDNSIFVCCLETNVKFRILIILIFLNIIVYYPKAELVTSTRPK